MNVMWIIAAVFLLPGYVFSAILLAGKGGKIIIGFSGLPEEEQAQWNEKLLGRFVGLVLLVFVMFLTGAFVACLFKNMIVAWIIIVFACLELTAGAIYVNKSSRFQKK